jgi:hypothetical protein
MVERADGPRVIGVVVLFLSLLFTTKFARSGRRRTRSGAALRTMMCIRSLIGVNSSDTIQAGPWVAVKRTITGSK